MTEWALNGYPVEKLWDVHASFILHAAFQIILYRQNLRKCLQALHTDLDNMLHVFRPTLSLPPQSEARNKLVRLHKLLAVRSYPFQPFLLIIL
jgi:hypothetical protein